MAYFSHDLGARNSADLLKVRMRYGAEGYGLYFMILERLSEDKDKRNERDYEALAFELHAEVEKVRSVVEDFGLFEFAEVDGVSYFYSESLVRRLQADARSTAGKKAANSRWSVTANKEQIASIASCECEIASCKNAVASCEGEIASCKNTSHDAYLKEKKREENKIKENPPQSATHASTREAGAERPLAEEERNEVVKIFSLYDASYKVSLQPMIRGVSSASDQMKIRRYLTDEKRTKDVWSLIKSWGDRPVHELIQCMNTMEQQGQLNPIAWEWWKALEVWRVMTSSDRNKVRNVLTEHPERWEDYVTATKEVDGNKKIKTPTRFIISRINQ